MDDQTGDMEIFESKQDSLCVGSTYDFYHRAFTSHFTDKKKNPSFFLSFYTTDHHRGSEEMQRQEANSLDIRDAVSSGTWSAGKPPGAHELGHQECR